MAMTVRTDSEHQLLDRLAVAGKATRLTLSELEVAKSLEADGLIFMIGNTLDAIIMPKGRHLLAELERKPKRTSRRLASRPNMNRMTCPPPLAPSRLATLSERTSCCGFIAATVTTDHLSRGWRQIDDLSWRSLAL